MLNFKRVQTILGEYEWAIYDEIKWASISCMIILHTDGITHERNYT